MSIRSSVLTQVNQVAKEQGKRLAPLSDDLALLDSGLDSMCFAIIVARLEDVLGIDPFSTAEDIGFPVTVGEFIQFYENAAS
jgi:acyl carrier protein